MAEKSGMITIAGRPNVGKSTLINRLVGEKIAIVSNKPQTTRNRICGIVNRGDCQFVFVDTPGFHRPRTKLGDYMVNVTRQSVSQVDAVLLMVEPIAHVGAQEAELLGQLKQGGEPVILVINKIDTVEKDSPAVTRFFYHPSCQSVSLGAGYALVYPRKRGGLRPEHDIIYLPLPCIRLAYNDCPRHIRAITFVNTAEIESQKITRLQCLIARFAVRHCRTRARCGYRRERKRRGAVFLHMHLQFERDIALRHTGSYKLQYMRKRLIPYPFRFGYQHELLFILHPARPFDEIAPGHEQLAVRGGAQLLVLPDRHMFFLEKDLLLAEPGEYLFPAFFYIECIKVRRLLLCLQCIP